MLYRSQGLCGLPSSVAHSHFPSTLQQNLLRVSSALGDLGRRQCVPPAVSQASVDWAGFPTGILVCLPLKAQRYCSWRWSLATALRVLSCPVNSCPLPTFVSLVTRPSSNRLLGVSGISDPSPASSLSSLLLAPLLRGFLHHHKPVSPLAGKLMPALLVKKVVPRPRHDFIN